MTDLLLALIGLMGAAMLGLLGWIANRLLNEFQDVKKDVKAIHDNQHKLFHIMLECDGCRQAMHRVSDEDGSDFRLMRKLDIDEGSEI